MPKKTAAAKKKAPAKSSAKRGRPATKSTAKKSPAKKSVKEVKKPASKKTGGQRGGANREVNPDTGFVVGTDQDAIATALLEGGESRAAIVEYLESTLDTETRNGTEKKITNMVSGVLNKMLAQGYTVESSFVLLPPTPASKRKATAAANKKSAAPAKKKPAAKKTTAKKGAAAKKRK